MKGPVGISYCLAYNQALIDAGIIDPAEVTRLALQNAASIAAFLLTTEALITDVPEKINQCLQCPWVAWAEACINLIHCNAPQRSTGF